MDSSEQQFKVYGLDIFWARQWFEQSKFSNIAGFRRRRSSLYVYLSPALLFWKFLKAFFSFYGFFHLCVNFKLCGSTNWVAISSRKIQPTPINYQTTITNKLLPRSAEHWLLHQLTKSKHVYKITFCLQNNTGRTNLYTKQRISSPYKSTHTQTRNAKDTISPVKIIKTYVKQYKNEESFFIPENSSQHRSKWLAQKKHRKQGEKTGTCSWTHKKLIEKQLLKCTS